MKKILVAVLLVLTLTLAACEEDVIDIDENLQIETDEDENVYSDDEIDSNLDTVVESIDVTDIDFDSLDTDLEGYIVLNASSEIIYIETAGTYLLEGVYTTSVVVNVGDEEDVDLILNGVTMSSSEGPCIIVLNADDVTVSAVANTVNTLEDASEYTLVLDEIEFDSVIYSKSDLEINGTGTINIEANYNNAVSSKDDLKVSEVTLNINSVDDGLVARDYIAFKETVITVNSTGDAIKTTNDEEEYKGFVYVESGLFELNTSSDGFDIVNNIIIYDGDFKIDAGDDGISSNGAIYIGGGSFLISADSDALNATEELVIYDGDFTLNAGDDGVHSDTTITIDGGTVEVVSSYEGIEAFTININGGSIIVNSSDDGINATSGGGQMHGTGYVSTGGFVNITGGLITVNATTGDGVDVNGSAVMTGGNLIVYGPSADNQSGLDFDESFEISGGTLIVLSSTGMMHELSATSTQASLLYADTESFGAGTEVTLYDESGDVLITIEAIRTFAGVIVSTENMVLDSSYELVVGSTSYDFDITSVLTSLGDGGTTMGAPRGNPGRRP